jgi:site-specific DNA-methyltransferase (adenine-specific)
MGDAMGLLRRARSETFDLIFADPPYFLSSGGVTCQGGKMVSVDKGMWDKPTTFEAIHAFNLEWLGECRRLLKPNGTLWVSGTLHNIYSVGFALQTLGYKILNDIAWYKVNPPPNLACRYFTHAVETLLWARKDAKARHVFNYEEMKRDNGGKQMQSLWHITPPAPREKRHGKHPTQKPEALLDRIIRASSGSGDLVLDPFCGSGTTGVVAARHGRRFVGFEREAIYLEIAALRLRDAAATVTVQVVFNFSPTAARPSSDEQGTKQGAVRATWTQIVSAALADLGGEGHLRDINHLVEKRARARLHGTWPCTVRRVVREARCIEAMGRGNYRLRGEQITKGLTPIHDTN